MKQFLKLVPLWLLATLSAPSPGPAQTATEPLSVAVPDPTSTTYQYYNDTSFSLTGFSSALTVFSAAPTGENSGGIADFTNNSGGAITLTNTTSVAGWNRLLNIYSTGGEGEDNQDGANGGYVSAYNFASLTASGIFNDGLSLFDVSSTGGNGILNSAGLYGGNAGNISVRPEGTLLAGSATNPIEGTVGLRGVSGVSTGGNAGQSPQGFAGGNGGTVTIDNQGNSSSISLYWHGTNTTGIAEVYGIYGASIGGQGYPAYNEDESGGGGGNGGAITINFSNAPITLVGDQGTTTQLTSGAAIAAFSTGAPGTQASYADNPNISYAGLGGSAAASSTSAITLDNAKLTVSGDYLGGILVSHTGGSGGDADPDGVNASYANAGGATGKIAVSVTDSTISTAGVNAVGIRAGNSGGLGGTAYEYSPEFGGTGGNGGNGGNTDDVTISLAGNTAISTNGSTSYGILAFSRAGNAGNAGGINAINSFGRPGVGGAGGNSGEITISLADSATISTDGTSSHGIVAQSSSGTGAAGGELKGAGDGDAGNGGNGGNSGAIAITVGPSATVQTLGTGSIAIVAESLSGGGGAGGNRETGFGNNGAGGKGGDTSTIEVSNQGTLSTAGANSLGIFAQNSSGGGGVAGNDYTIFYSSPQAGGASGSVGDTTITNTGTITTAGTNATGVLALSLSGGGGTAGSDSGLVSLGGEGGPAANAGAVYFNNSGKIQTQGDNSYAVLLQSIGGGGGYGGDSQGLYALGGSGGGGGNGGAITAKLGGGSLITTGAQASGLVAQSIGGGGGNSGNATSDSTKVSIAIGGSGGSGGNGGEVEVASAAAITTMGTASRGILAQSIGGGGGTGGEALALDVSLGISAGVALGGTGGNGGRGGAVGVGVSGGSIWAGQFDSTNPTATYLLPTDAIGILAQSIGGGGGAGGSSVATATAIGLPTKEGNIFSAAFSYSEGGAGGTGGSGGDVEVLLEPNTQITTQGQGSHGVLAQSIGGGGGAGGDSSAMSTTVEYTRVADQLKGSTYTANIAISSGGKGSSGGSGLEAVIDTKGNATVTTYGDYSNGLTAQSIGGGGGNAGLGSGTTAGYGSSKAVNATLILGSQGGTGGDGQGASIQVAEDSTITTYGSSSHGIVAQVISGGGGTSQGGMISLSGQYTAEVFENKVLTKKDISPTGTLNLTLGARGGDGGTIISDTYLPIQGKVYTYGNDSIGVLAQSIGGGGGVAGTAGSDASADNPINVLTGVRGKVTALLEGYVPFSASTTATLGALIDGESNGGDTDIELSNLVQTQGDWSHGVVGQSIGGGGGKAGSAVATGSEATMYVGTVKLGGASGVNGSGATVNLSLSDATIITGAAQDGRGFSAFGVLLQSIGGGGGLWADGSDLSNGSVVAFDEDGNLISKSAGSITIGGEGSGSGGAVNLSGSGTIVTYGEAAHGIVLQSIGGGGGVAGAGSSAKGASTTAFNITLAGSANAGNGSQKANGGAVTVSDAVLTVQTSGDNAFGLIAQSIGGGGGLGAFVEPASGVVLAANTQNTTGGVVTLTFDSGTQITTSGVNAHGIVAQSIGAGGGIAGYANGGTFTAGFRNNGEANGLGQAVNITLAEGASITTTGAGAHGILAQSLSHGGGLYLSGGNIIAGAVGNLVPGNYDDDLGGAVNIDIGGSVTVSGDNAIGIFAQSAGDVHSGYEAGHTIAMTISGSVVATGTAIYIDGGEVNNSVTIEAGGLVSGATAVKETSQAVTVTNYGTLSGSLQGNDIKEKTKAELNSPRRSGTQLHNFGHFYSGPIVEADVKNSGIFSIGRIDEESRFTRTRVVGNLTQTERGRLHLTSDFYKGKADFLSITGDATFDGRLIPRPITLVPDVEIPVVSISGKISGTLDVDNSGLDSRIFSYELDRRAAKYYLSATDGEFTAGLDLSPNQAAVAKHFSSIWHAGANAEFSKIFAKIDRLATGDLNAYNQLLNELSPGALLGFSARRLAGTKSYGTAVLNGPVFEGQTAKPSEISATWARMIARNSQQDVEGGFSDFSQNSAMWIVGGQSEFAGDWFLGGSAGYQYDWLGSGNISGDGHTALGAITLKKGLDAWLFAGAITGSASWFEAERTVTVPGFQGKAESSPSTQSVGGVLRAAYTFANERFYLRPLLTFQAIYVRSDGYTESGTGPLSLRVEAEEQTTVIGSPGIEFGLRTDFDNGQILRSYVNLEANFSSNDAWEQSARFVGAPGGAGDFATTIPLDDISGRITAGFQLQTSERTSIFVQYDGEFSENLRENGGSFGVKFEY